MANIIPLISSIGVLRTDYTQMYERFCAYAPTLRQAADEQICIYVSSTGTALHVPSDVAAIYILIDTDVHATWMYTIDTSLSLTMVLAPRARVHAQFVQAQHNEQRFDLSVVQQHASKTLVEVVQQKGMHMHVDIALRDMYAEGTLTVIACLAQEQAAELVTYQRHEAPHTQSKVQVKTVLADRASYTHQGMLDVAADAHDVVAYEQSDHLLCDATARAYVVPAMQVRNNEVQCTHASAIGLFDLQLIWYICSRGLSEQAAHALLIRAYIASVVSPDASFAELVAHIVEEHLHTCLGIALAETEYV